VQKKIKGRESKARQQTHVCHKTANMGHLLGLRFVVREFRSKSKSKSKSNSKSKSKSNSKSKSKSKSKSNSNSNSKSNSKSELPHPPPGKAGRKGRAPAGTFRPQRLTLQALG
jgi:hypothetical protein